MSLIYSTSYDFQMSTIKHFPAHSVKSELWITEKLRENFPNTEFFLVRIFLYTNHKKLRIWTHFTQWEAWNLLTFSNWLPFFGVFLLSPFLDGLTISFQLFSFYDLLIYRGWNNFVQITLYKACDQDRAHYIGHIKNYLRKYCSLSCHFWQLWHMTFDSSR